MNLFQVIVLNVVVIGICGLLAYAMIPRSKKRKKDD